MKGILKSTILFLAGAMIFALNSNASITNFNGKTFTYAGPNCFGVALFAANLNSIIRGVDIGEFRNVLSKSCHKVKTPKRGDLGVYSVKGFDYIHAFYYLDKNTIIEKTGVDTVLGKTPIHVRSFEHSYHTFGYSKDCLRYATKEEKTACYNVLEYFRCQPSQMPLSKSLSAIENLINRIYTKLLNSPKSTKDEFQKISLEISNLLNDYQYRIEAFESKNVDFFRSRLESYRLQLEYFILSKPKQ